MAAKAHDMVEVHRVLAHHGTEITQKTVQAMGIVTTGQWGPCEACLQAEDKFNDRGGRVCNIFFPVLGGNGTKIAPTGDRFDQPPGQMR